MLQPAPPAGLRLPPVELPTVDELPPFLVDHAERIRAEAEAILRHEVSFLGSGSVELGEEIDWHTDFKTGIGWPKNFYLDLQVVRRQDRSDPKLPWELSRGHQLLTLARATRLFEDARYGLELHAQLDSWLDENPPGYGINWANPMEVAVRAINWIWALRTSEPVHPLAEPLRTRVAQSLVVHGRHIAANLEGSPLLRGNHYLADMVGLATIGAFMHASECETWRREAHRALEREIRSQVHRDGCGFEASLPYHGVALELFTVGLLAVRASGRRPSTEYLRQLAGMVEVSRDVRHPNGRLPVIGDQDSGRILPAGFARPPTHDPLVWLAASLLGGGQPLEGLPHEEVAWTLGIEAWRTLASRRADRRAARAAFEDGGLYILRGPRTHLVARWGDVGQAGNGGHAHNDVSSYELSFDGLAVVVDPGTYTYTADLSERDRYRAAAAHNVLTVDGRDMHPLPAGEPFRLPQHARVSVERFDADEETIVLTGRHDGFRRSRDRIICRRTIRVGRLDSSVEVIDEVTGGGGVRRLESRIHLATEVNIEALAGRVADLTIGGLSFAVVFQGADEVAAVDAWVSAVYGERERTTCLVGRAVATLPARISYRIVPARSAALRKDDDESIPAMAGEAP